MDKEKFKAAVRLLMASKGSPADKPTPKEEEAINTIVLGTVDLLFSIEDSLKQIADAVQRKMM